MRVFHTFALHLAIIAAIAASCALVNGQDSSPGATPDLIAVSIAMKQDSVPAGTKPWMILTAKNISSHNIYPYLIYDFHLHVLGEKGEPPRTYYHRQLLHEPGVPALAAGMPRPPLILEGGKPYEGIPPGGLDVKQFDLTVYYDLIPGQYTVYMDVMDKAGVWLRTNTVQFEIQPPTQ